MTAINAWADVSAIAKSIQEDAIFAVTEMNVLPNLVTVMSDMSGGNLRKNYTYANSTAATIGETTDLTSTAASATIISTLTPEEIGMQFAVSDLRAESESPDRIQNDGARRLAIFAANKVEADLYSEFGNLTGGSIGNVGSVPTWGYFAAAIAIARDANKSSKVPLACVMHGYQWSVLAKSASIAGATVATAPGYIDEITRTGYVGTFMGVPLYQIYPGVTGTGATAWCAAAVFPRESLALDWRRPIRVEAQRDASMRGTEFNMSAVYAHGVWRPALGVYLHLLAVTPTGV
jgi:hypothetical protein